MTYIKSLLTRFTAAARDTSGAATVEFVFVFPFFLAIFISAFDMAAMNIRAVSMERATDVAIREVRLSWGAVITDADGNEVVDADGNTTDKIDYSSVLTDVCSMVFMIDDCEKNVKIELRPVSTTTWDLPPSGIDCSVRDGKINPPTAFSKGIANELMLVRVCAVVDPFFPSIGVGRTMPKTADGGYIVVATSAFVNEPD